jgi:hypothetical protein
MTSISMARLHRSAEQCAWTAPSCMERNLTASLPLLYLHFLMVTPMQDKDIESVWTHHLVAKICPWSDIQVVPAAFWFCSLPLQMHVGLGTLARECSQPFLHASCLYFERVKIQSTAEQPESQQWIWLHRLSVLNNQACTFNELCLHNQAESQLTKMTRQIILEDHQQF